VGARDEVVRHEGDADVVVGTALECVQLATQIAAPGQRDDTDRPVGARAVDELDPRTRLDVDVDQKEMGLPLRERVPGVVDRSTSPGSSLRRPSRIGSAKPTRPAAAKRALQRKSVARPQPYTAQTSGTEAPSVQVRSAARRRRTAAATPGSLLAASGRPPSVATKRKPGPS
jgi:hypothetical protein